jgi:hypothetical protein
MIRIEGVGHTSVHGPCEVPSSIPPPPTGRQRKALWRGRQERRGMMVATPCAGVWEKTTAAAPRCATWRP